MNNGNLFNDKLRYRGGSLFTQSVQANFGREKKATHTNKSQRTHRIRYTVALRLQ